MLLLWQLLCKGCVTTYVCFLQEQETLAGEKKSMEAVGVSGGDILKLNVCGEHTSATRGVLTQVQLKYSKL